MSEQPRPTVKETRIPVDEVAFSLYQSSEKIYARSVKGIFDRWRWIMVWATQLFFYGVPWLLWDNRQAMLFDLEAKRFYIFGIVLHPQDLIYLSFLLIISALALFLFTAVAGRLWCGYTCPQTVYTEIFMWIEQKIEGDRMARMRLDEAKLSINKVWRKSAKQFVWITFALWTGITFVGYFTPIRELLSSLVSFNLGPWETFWVCFYSFATYGNAGYMREQVCKYMCPYARFQSAMFDDDTLIVTYDQARGEPRGARSKKADENINGLGSCIDCSICVQVCPTGIDIRKGLQYECIGCGACIDACDDVMDKMGYEKGLIKYSTQNAMNKGWRKNEIIRRIIRPRVLIYTAILASLTIGMAVSLYNKASFRVDVQRDKAMLARLNSEGQIENVYRLKIENNAEKTQSYTLVVDGVEGLNAEIAEDHLINGSSRLLTNIKPFENRDLVLELQVNDGEVKAGTYPVHLTLTASQTGEVVKEKTVFIVPSN